MKFFAAAFVSSLVIAGSAQAGCLTGAAVGGAAGHYAGHHGVLGAVGGCAFGHHVKRKHEREEANRAAADGRSHYDRTDSNSEP